MAPTTRLWPTYGRARHRLGGAARASLDEQLTAWVIGLVAAEFEGKARDYPGASGAIGWLELADFRVLIRVRLDDSGQVEHFDFLDVRAR